MQLEKSIQDGAIDYADIMYSILETIKHIDRQADHLVYNPSKNGVPLSGQFKQLFTNIFYNAIGGGSYRRKKLISIFIDHGITESKDIEKYDFVYIPLSEHDLKEAKEVLSIFDETDPMDHITMINKIVTLHRLCLTLQAAIVESNLRYPLLLEVSRNISNAVSLCFSLDACNECLQLLR